MGGAVNYLYELKGRGEHVVYPETRSVCLLELYCFWIRNEEVPKCILEYIYRQYNLRGVEHTSAKKQYEPLKRAILSCYPDIEEALYGEEGRAKLISNWYREMMRIISDCERFYEEPEEVKGRVAALFSGEDWEKIRYLPELFVKMELQLSGRSVIPSSLAKRLMEHFSDGAGVRERVWEREQGEILAEGMVHSLYYTRMIMDMHGAIPQVTPYFENGAFKEIYKEEIERYSEAIACQDFWHYFLMRGFDFRGARIAGRDKYRREYMAGMKVILPAYIEYLYQPSLRWQQLLKIPSFCRLFSDEGGEVLPETEFVLPDGKCFRAEFHLHYVRYFLDGREVFEKVYDFMEYAELAKSMDSTEQLIILLAVTKINAGDCVAAQEMVKCLLSGLPLAPVSIPVIARLLTEGEEEIEGGKHRAKTYYPHISMEMAAESIRRGGNGFEGEENGDSSDGRMETGGNSLLGIFYAEDEELCFRAVVGESGFTVYRQNDFGFEQIYSVEFPCGISAQEKQCAAREFLQGLKRPVPALASTVCLEGMTEVEKAQQILSALKQDALYRGSKHGLLPYAPGYPWEEKDTGNALQYFYREYGGYLSECYCVLHFGEDDTQDKKDHVFYCSMKPFGFSLALRALDWLSSYEFREKELRQKVKEKHWVVGHFGWGGLTGPQGEAVPKIIAVGESGTYYYYDVVRLVRKESLAELLARMFDFSKVVSVENYKGELSISRFDGELEYCYGREALLQSVYTPEKTVADIFTIFTKSEMMGEFAIFMDGILDGIAWELKDLYFEFSAIGDGAYSMRVHRQDIDCLLEDDTTCEDLMGDQKPLVWKIWQRGRNDGEMKRDFKDTIYWYMECGKYGRKLASLKKITAGFDLGEGDELMVCLSCSRDGRKELEWHRNKLDGRNNSGTVWLD